MDAETNNHFSVVMSVYRGDQAHYFCEACESLFAQTCPPAEIILVIDGPIGGELDAAVTRYASRSTVKLLQLEKNVGLGGARHQAILMAAHSIIAVMDADDLCQPNRFELQLAAIREVDVVGGYIAEFELQPSNPQRIRAVPLTYADIVASGRWLSPFNHVTIMFRRESYLRIGGYRPVQKVEDYDLFHRMIIGGLRLANIPVVLVLVRASNEQYSRRRGWAYFREEISLYDIMLRSGYLNRWEWGRNIAIRLGTRFLPAPLLGMISRRVLRKSLS